MSIITWLVRPVLPVSGFLRQLGFILIFIGVLGGSNAHSATTLLSPEQLITRFHDVLLETMKDAQKLGVKGRYERLAPALTETFHMASMIQIASGSSWRKASDEQKENLIKAFSKLTIATYASQFDGFSGQNFEMSGTKPGPQNTILVETVLKDPSGSDVDLVYVVRQFEGKWHAIDVLLDTGISELARKRSEYRQTLKKGGVESLLQVLADKTRSLLAP